MIKRDTTTDKDKKRDMSKVPRTWRFYCEHDVRNYSFEVRYNVCLNLDDPGQSINLKLDRESFLRTIGSLVDLDREPDLETFKVLWEVQKAWEKLPYGKKKYDPGVPGYDVRHVMSSLIEDVLYDMDPEIFRWFLTEEIFTEDPPTKKNGKDPWTYPFCGMTLHLVKHPSCPPDVLDRMITLPKDKDPTGQTNGGNILAFLVYNTALTGDQLLKIAQMSKRVRDQKDVLEHSNVTREVVRYLSTDGRSSSVKKSALKFAMDRGWVSV